MKKIFGCLMVLGMIIASMTVFAAEDTITEDVMLIMAPVDAEDVVIDTEKMVADAILIDGNKLEIPQNMGKIIEKDGVVYAPVRVVLETMGYQVNWTDAEKMVMGINTSNGKMIIMQVDNTLLFCNEGQNEGKITMEAPIFLNLDECRTYIPVKALAEALGYRIGFDTEINTVTLSK